jgi:hypothetical protein
VRDVGALPDGRSLDEARDSIWICNAPELYVSLTMRRGWSTQRYVSWARNAQIKPVIEPPLASAQPDAASPTRPRDDELSAFWQ